MADLVVPRIKVPAVAQPGETIEIKTLIHHAMESGQRRDGDGKLIPRKIIHTFICSFNGTPFFTANFGTGISANPFLSFFFKATESGTLDFKWIDDDGTEYTAHQTLTVG